MFAATGGRGWEVGLADRDPVLRQPECERETRSARPFVVPSADDVGVLHAAAFPVSIERRLVEPARVCGIDVEIAQRHIIALVPSGEPDDAVAQERLRPTGGMQRRGHREGA